MDNSTPESNNSQSTPPASASSSSNNSSSNKRSIRFANDEELCVYHTGAVMDIEEVCRKEIWFQQPDLSHIKRKAMMVAKDTLRYGFGTLLTNTYGKTDQETQEALNTWTRNGGNRRGLERWINDEYAAKRADIRRRTIKSVLRAQRKMQEEGVNDVEYATKVLSRLSEAFSQDSRNFARAMGIADEHAALVEGENNELGEDKDRKMLVRQQSPTSVAFTSFPQPPKRNLRIPSNQVNDMRHYY